MFTPQFGTTVFQLSVSLYMATLIQTHDDAWYGWVDFKDERIGTSKTPNRDRQVMELWLVDTIHNHAWKMLQQAQIATEEALKVHNRVKELLP